MNYIILVIFIYIFIGMWIYLDLDPIKYPIWVIFVPVVWPLLLITNIIEVEYK